MGVMLLLVEDEPLIIDVVEDAFTEAGYQVITASDGGEALKELEADATRFRAIVTDVKLGSGPNGWAVAHRAREIVPTMAVVYMSGDSGHEWASEGVPGSVMVAKPFATVQLVTAVSVLINESDMRAWPPAEQG